MGLGKRLVLSEAFAVATHLCQKTNGSVWMNSNVVTLPISPYFENHTHIHTHIYRYAIFYPLSSRWLSHKYLLHAYVYVRCVYQHTWEVLPACALTVCCLFLVYLIPEPINLPFAGVHRLGSNNQWPYIPICIWSPGVYILYIFVIYVSAEIDIRVWWCKLQRERERVCALFLLWCGCLRSIDESLVGPHHIHPP